MRTNADQKKCGGCGGKKWMVLQPMNFVAPCVVCSGDRKLGDIENEKNMVLTQDCDGYWMEKSK